MENLPERPCAPPTERQPRWWNFNRITALTTAGIASALLYAVPYQVERPARLFGRALSGLNPALFPRLVLGTLLFVSIAYLLIGSRLHEPNLLRTVGARGYFNIAVTLVCVLAFAFALPQFGYVISGVALIVVLTVFYGNRNHLLTAIVGALVPTTIYFGFTRLLHVSLPEFPFF